MSSYPKTCICCKVAPSADAEGLLCLPCHRVLYPGWEIKFVPLKGKYEGKGVGGGDYKCLYRLNGGPWREGKGEQEDETVPV